MTSPGKPDGAAALAEADAALRPYAEAGEPGAAILALHRGRVLFAQGWGLANVEAGVAWSSNTRMQLASMSKQFTAAAFVVLQARGKLSLHAPLASLAPDTPPSLARLTLQQLLSMRGGLMEAGHIAWFATGDVHHAWRNDVHTLASAAALPHRNRPPGGHDLYSNTHYVLAQQIGESVTGKPWAQVLQQLVFEPLGMAQTSFVTSARQAQRGLATAYRPAGDGFERCAWPVQDGAATGVVSTLADLARWHRNLRRNRLDPPDLVPQLLHDEPFADGSGSCYRLGLREGRLFGRRVVGHAGGIPGCRTESYWFPEEDLSVVVLSNREDLRESLLTARIAGALLGEPRWPESRPTELAPHVGVYVDTTSSRVLVVEQDAGYLHVDGSHFVRNGQTVFVSTHPFFPRQLVFTNDSTSVVALVPGHRAEYRRVQVSPVLASEVPELLGRYHQTGLPWPVTLTSDQAGQLTFVAGPDGPARSAAAAGRIGPDLYVLGDHAGGHSPTSFGVLRNADGAVRAIQIDGYRLLGLALERL